MDEPLPDATRAFSLLRTLAKGEKHSAENTHELLELIRNMASANIISRLESKMDAMKESQDTKLDELEKTVDKNYKFLFWVVGIVGAAITIAIALSG